MLVGYVFKRIPTVALTFLLVSLPLLATTPASAICDIAISATSSEKHHIAAAGKETTE